MSFAQAFFSAGGGSPLPTTTVMSVVLILVPSILSDNKTANLLSFDYSFSDASFPSPLLSAFLDLQIIDVFL